GVKDLWHRLKLHSPEPVQTVSGDHMNNCFCNSRTHSRKALSSRREFLTRCGMGMGAIGLTGLLSEELLGQAKATHFPAKAKHVIHIFAAGAPSQVDTWDPKPELTRMNGKPLTGENGVAMA